MPVSKSGIGPAPKWCEMETSDIIALRRGESHTYERTGRREKLIVGAGKCRIAYEGRTITAEEGANLDLSTTDGKFVVLDTFADAILIRMCGHWGHETGGSGLFTVEQGDPALDRGDPVSYPKETAFDSHHHDFPRAFEPVKAVYFETTLDGQKRLGHLCEHTHGPAQPVHVQELLARAQESLAVQTRDVVCGLIDVEQR